MEENNFEKSMENLENIVTELEKGELNLDESVKKFEEGMKIAKQCNNILENAEKKITILLEKMVILKKSLLIQIMNKREKQHNEQFSKMITNRYLYIPLILWFCIQTFKVIYELIKTKNLTLKEL